MKISNACNYNYHPWHLIRFPNPQSWWTSTVSIDWLAVGHSKGFLHCKASSTCSLKRIPLSRSIIGLSYMVMARFGSWPDHKTGGSILHNHWVLLACFRAIIPCWLDRFYRGFIECSGEVQRSYGPKYSWQLRTDWNRYIETKFDRSIQKD